MCSLLLSSVCVIPLLGIFVIEYLSLVIYMVREFALQGQISFESFCDSSRNCCREFC